MIISVYSNKDIYKKKIGLKKLMHNRTTFQPAFVKSTSLQHVR